MKTEAHPTNDWLVQELFADIRTALEAESADMASRYRQMGRVFERVLKERTQQDKVEYCGLVPRIYALAQRYGCPHQPLSVLYSHLVRSDKGLFLPQPDDFLYDAKALSTAVAAFYQTPVPGDIEQRLPQQWRALSNETLTVGSIVRMVVQSWDEEYIYGYDFSDAGRLQLRVVNDSSWHLSSQLYPLATLNLVDAQPDESSTWHARLYILEPDYLVDITAICQCLRESGPSPMFYLMEKFMPREETLAIQLGNAANQFLDDAVHGQTSFLDSMQRNFKDYALRYCTLNGVDEAYFRQCQQQYDNILKATSRHFREAGIDTSADSILLEPSFVCDVLGLQGRMDLLTTDLRKIVELKSGKQDDYHGTFRMEHALQMALYKEVLHYSLGRPRSQVQTLLLYSRYPNLYDIRLGGDSVAQAMRLRNGIVDIDRRLRTDCAAFLRSISEPDFNPLGSQSKLYQLYIRPRIERFLAVIHQAAPLDYAYFCTMTSFLQREQMLAKIGDDRPDSQRGFAQAWQATTEDKLQHGNIITDLRLSPILDDQGCMTHAVADMVLDDTAQPNFREGDSVVLYERNAEGDLMTNRQSLHCYIEQLHPDRLLLRFAHPQRGAAWLRPDSRYAIEPGHSDALFAAQYRGLFALLTCPPVRRSLVLGGTPDPDACRLLVGPPGSGKTSIALRQMVMDLLQREPEANILLMAYTNRAVDEICQMLASLPDSPDFLRLGQELACQPTFRPRLLRNAVATCTRRTDILQRLSPVRIFCGTVASLCGSPELFLLKHFHTAFLDEASQVLEPQLMPLLVMPGADGQPAIQRFVLIGDHKQLPAVVAQQPRQSAVNDPQLHSIGLLDCRNSFFERLMRQSPQLSQMLTRQGRMHADINRFASQAYYGGKLEPVPLPHQTGPLPWQCSDSTDPMLSYVATHRMGLRDVQPDPSETNNKANRREADEVAKLVVALHSLTVQCGQAWVPEQAVGIVVPFRSQVAMVRCALRRAEVPGWESITVDTVERYQGSQREVIIYSTVVRRRYQLAVLSEPVPADGMPVDRKLNVAVTRARQQFFLVGNIPLLSLAPDYLQLVQYISRLSDSDNE